jgi:hypothetical protein
VAFGLGRRGSYPLDAALQGVCRVVGTPERTTGTCKIFCGARNLGDKHGAGKAALIRKAGGSLSS